MLKAILRAETKILPNFIGVDLGPQGYAVVRINKITARSVPAEAAAKQDRGQYGQWWTSAEGLAYYAVLKERFKVEMRAPKPVSTPSELATAALQ
jgi:peptidyl-prolyl cis-trans isomerase D